MLRREEQAEIWEGFAEVEFLPVGAFSGGIEKKKIIRIAKKTNLETAKM